MWKTAMRQSFQGIYICRCKRKLRDEQTSITPRAVAKEFIAQGMHYQELSFVVNVGRYIAGFIGTTEERNQLFGDA